MRREALLPAIGRRGVFEAGLATLLGVRPAHLPSFEELSTEEEQIGSGGIDRRAVAVYEAVQRARG
jgi:hypothetical protein